MSFAKAVLVLVTRIFARRVADGLVQVATSLQMAVNAVFLGIDLRAWHKGLLVTCCTLSSNRMMTSLVR